MKEVKVPPFPDIASLATWKSTLYTACLEASNVTDPGPVVRWLQAVEEPRSTFDSFIESGRGFARLDYRLAAALKRVCGVSSAPMACKELYKAISREENLAIQHRRVLTGRQILWMILQTFKTNADLGVVYGIYHFQSLKWPGDDLRHLEEFRNNWCTLVNHQSEPLTDNQLAELLFRVMEHSPLLKNDLADYSRRVHETRRTDYKQLMGLLDRHIGVKRERLNDRDLFDHLKKTSSGGGPSGSRRTAAPATRDPSVKRKDQRKCKFYGTKEGCKRGKDCPFLRSAGGDQILFSRSVRKKGQGAGAVPAPRLESRPQN